MVKLYKMHLIMLEKVLGLLVTVEAYFGESALKGLWVKT